MKICVLASGSKGNSCYVETDKTRSLIDLGCTCGYCEKALRDIGVEPSSIQRIFITHAHSDHVNGLRVFLKKYKGVTVYLTPLMDEEINLMIDNVCYIGSEEVIDDLSIRSIKTSHDAKDSNGYVLSSGGKKILYMTDTGYINIRNFDLLKGMDLYVLESNHDVEMLMNGHYPYYLKQRILGDKGHLSNKDCAYYLTKFVTSNTKLVILAHLSEHNNSPEKAINTYYEEFKKEGIKAPNVIVASQRKHTDVIEI